MEIIKCGKPYRKHKCSRCKSVYIYHIKYGKNLGSDLICCPVCGDYLDFHFYDKKISREKYNSLKVNEWKK